MFWPYKMTKKTNIINYTAPEQFPIPEGTNPADSLDITLSRIEGILSLLIDSEGKIPDSGELTGYAVWAIEGMVKQCQDLVTYWHKMDQGNQ